MINQLMTRGGPSCSQDLLFYGLTLFEKALTSMPKHTKAINVGHTWSCRMISTPGLFPPLGQHLPAKVHNAPQALNISWSKEFRSLFLCFYIHKPGQGVKSELSLSLSLSSTVRSWHMMTYVPCCLALHHQGANKLAGCCLQLWVSPKTWRAHGCFYGLYSFRSQPCWQPCWQCSCFPGPKIHSFFRQKFHLHARGPHHLFPDEFHQISSPMLCSPVHRGEAVLIPHLRAVRRSSCITHSSVASETPSFRYLRLTNWIEATSMLKATAFQATYQSFLEASCKYFKPPQETRTVSDIVGAENPYPGSPGRPSSFIWISSWMRPSGSFTKLSESFMISSS